MSDKSERLLKIYGRLKRGPVTIEIIKQWAKKNDIKVSERTFYRDLKDLESSLMLDDEKIVVTEGEKNKKVWKIEFSNSREKLAQFDMNSYLLFKNFLPLPVVLSRQKSLDKIEELFYSTYSKSRFEDFVTMADQQISGTHFYEVDDVVNYGQIIEDLIWSIQNKREILINEIDYDYTSIASTVQLPFVFLPVQLLYHRGVVHVSGFVKSNRKLVILALEQISKYMLTNLMYDNHDLLELLQQRMERRFGITENIDNRIYDIEIEFSDLTGTFVKNQFWHSTQKFETLPNGNICMKLTCGINRELVGWIFQWMSNAKVIKPKRLQDMVSEKYKEICRMYDEEIPLIANNTFRS